MSERERERETDRERERAVEERQSIYRLLVIAGCETAFVTELGQPSVREGLGTLRSRWLRPDTLDAQL